MNPEETNPPSASSRIRQLAPAAIVLFGAIAAVSAYLQAFGYPFVIDDDLYITDNHRLAELRPSELWRLLVQPYNSFSEFLPLRDLSYWLDITLFGLNPSAFRLHNILLYLLCLPLAYATTLELWRYFRPADTDGAPWVAAIATALFALHPTLIEPVVWISGRKYVLPNLFSMLALWLALRARRAHGLSAPYAAAAMVAFAAVMLSKASYFTVAPVIALLWILFWLDVPMPHRRYSQLLWPLSMLLMAAILIIVFIDSSIGKMPFYPGIETVTRSLAIMGWLARLAVSPESRHFFYPVFEDVYLPAMAALGLAVLAAAAVGAIAALRKRSLEGFILTVFFLLCLPYLQLVPYAAPSLVSDRFLALAAWPAMLLVATLSWRLKPAPRMLLLLAIVLPWSFQITERPRDWRSFEAIIDADLRAYPGHYMPSVFKAWEIQVPDWLHGEAIETASAIAEPEIRDFTIKLIQADHAVFVESASTASPYEAMNRLLELGSMLRQPHAQEKWNPPVANYWRGTQVAVESEWKSLVERFPGNALVRYNTGLWMLGVKKHGDAAGHLRAAIESQRLPRPMLGTAFRNFGLALVNSGQVAEAEAALLAALAQQPPDTQAYCLLSGIYRQTNRPDEAARAEADCRNSTRQGETTP